MTNYNRYVIIKILKERLIIMKNKKLQNQIGKVMDELYKLHEMLPEDERTFYFYRREQDLVAIAQMISVSISLAETEKEVMAEMNSA